MKILKLVLWVILSLTALPVGYYWFTWSTHILYVFLRPEPSAKVLSLPDGFAQPVFTKARAGIIGGAGQREVPILELLKKSEVIQVWDIRDNGNTVVDCYRFDRQAAIWEHSQQAIDEHSGPGYLGLEGRVTDLPGRRVKVEYSRLWIQSIFMSLFSVLILTMVARRVVFGFCWHCGFKRLLEFEIGQERTIADMFRLCYRLSQHHFYRFLGKTYQCGCGHSAKKKTYVVVAEDSAGIYTLAKDLKWCPECFRRASIKCFLCGQTIVPNSPVVLYRITDPEFRIPEGAHVHKTDPLTLVGCLGWDCCDIPAGRNAFWIMPGEIERVVSPIEQLLASNCDGTVTVNDQSDRSGAIVIK